MTYLPPELLWPITFVFGVVFGSFANVVIDRLHTGKSLNDRSRCFSCGKTLQWYELFPLLSFVLLRGRCQGCSARIPARFFFVELLMGLLFVHVIYTFGLTAIGFLSLPLVFILVVIVIYDIRHLIIPNELAALVAISAMAIAVVKYDLISDPYRVLTVLASGIALFSLYGGLWLVSRGRWIGFGDAKLAFSLGLLIELPQLFSLVVWSFWVGAVISVCLLGLVRLHKTGTTRLGLLPSQLTMKSEVPFAPFLIIAFGLIYFYQLDVLDLIAYVVTTVY